MVLNILAGMTNIVFKTPTVKTRHSVSKVDVRTFRFKTYDAHPSFIYCISKLVTIKFLSTIFGMYCFVRG